MTANQKYCPKCGTPSLLDAVFCVSCGNKFPEPVASFVPSPPPIQDAYRVNPPPLPLSGYSDFITLACPNCGGKLQITPDTERFACQFCGYEHIVRRSGGSVSLEPVVKLMKNIDSNLNMVGVGVNRLGLSSEKQVAEQTIERLKKEIDELNTRLGSYEDSIQIILILGIIMGIIGIALIVGAILSGWKPWVWIIALALVGFGIAITVSATKTPENIKAQNELVRQKREELQRNYEIVRRS